MNNSVSQGLPCNVTPIICPEKVVCVHCTYCYEQPVVMPVRTHVINHYVPRYTYQYAKTTSEENVCHGQASQSNRV